VGRGEQALDRSVVSALCVLLLLGFAATAQAAPKTDKVLLKNGDLVTGEMKEVTQGLLRYSTDSMSTIYLEWIDVVRLTSSQTFQFEMNNGDFYFGSLLPLEKDFHILIGIGEFRIELAMIDVVRITPILAGFWHQLDGSLSLGFQFTKASEVLQWTLTSSVERRKRKFLSQLSLRIALTTTGSDPTSKNNSLGFSHDRFLGHKWAAGGALTFQQNDELGIAFRTLVSGTGTRALVQTTRQRLTLAAGLSFNRENTTESEIDNSIEGIVTLNWNIFKYKSPKTDFSFTLNVFPSVTQSGRVRLESNTRLRQELVKDFFWDLTGWYSADNQPPGGAEATNDFGITTSLGWTF
jgi:hypothetical protein